MSATSAFKALLLVNPALSGYPGEIRSQLSGKCWDLPGMKTENGNKLWQWNCAGTDNQRWTWDDSTFTLRLTAFPDKCVDVDANDFTNGVQPQIWDCAGTPQQMVGFDDSFGSIYFAATGSDASKCVDLAGGCLDDGCPLAVWDCNDSANQQYWYTPDASPTPPPPPMPDSAVSYIKSRETGKCLDIPNGNVQSGQTLWFWDCSGLDAQKWQFKNGNIVSAADNNMCVELPDNDGTNGKIVQLSTCSGESQQFWSYADDNYSIYMSQSFITTHATKCFQMQDSSGIDGTPLEIWNCLPYGNQQFYMESASSLMVM